MRWVAHDALHEDAHRRLMQLYLTCGDQAAALRAYETCHAMLAEQLRTQPAPETEALAERIRTAGSGSRAPLPPSSSHPMLRAAPSFEVPLVGRASEYGKLIETYPATQCGCCPRTWWRIR